MTVGVAEKKPGRHIVWNNHEIHVPPVAVAIEYNLSAPASDLGGIQQSARRVVHRKINPHPAQRLMGTQTENA